MVGSSIRVRGWIPLRVSVGDALRAKRGSKGISLFNELMRKNGRGGLIRLVELSRVKRYPQDFKFSSLEPPHMSCELGNINLWLRKTSTGVHYNKKLTCPRTKDRGGHLTLCIKCQAIFQTIIHERTKLMETG